ARVGGAAASAAGPITVDRDATAFALFITVVILMFFLCARTAFRRGGVRTTIRGIAIMGAIIVALALLQHARAPRQYYFMWRSHVSNALVFTPFINRNDFASWLVMALPLTGGYAVARVQSSHRPGQTT